MQLLEFQAKELLRQANLPVPDGLVVSVGNSVPALALPVVVKSQVPVGGRGKLGGVRLVKNTHDLHDAITTISHLKIKGHIPAYLLLEEALDIQRELYLSLQVNRDDRRIEWIASGTGGVEIESHSGGVLIIDSKDPRAHEQLSSILDIPEKILSPVLSKLERCFCNNDLLLLEVNPLVVTHTDQLVCADAKVMVDDNARFRHEDFNWSEPENIKPLGGTIGVIANGAGMAMSTMDTIYAAGGRPANFLDIGGGTGEDVFVKNLRVINDMPGVTSIIVNIFAGITHCDDIARGIIAALKQIPNLAPLFIRLEGTNRDEAATLLQRAGIALQPDLRTCIEFALQVDVEPKTADHRKSLALGNKRVTLGGADRAAGPAYGDLRGNSERISNDGSGQMLALMRNQPTLVQGITGHHGAFHTERMLASGTNIVAGVTPGKAGQTVHGVPVYACVQDAIAAHRATASVVFVPARFAKDAVLEAIDAGIRLIVIITEGIPVHDMLLIHQKSVATNTTIVGPNCPGFIVPRSHKLGIIASHITSPGHTTIISRSGTLTYELADALTKKGIGQRLILGIGGDPVQGMTFVEALKFSQADPETDQIVLIGEIGGEGEIRAAKYIDEYVTKPVYGLIVGHSLPPGQTFGHAGAIVSAKAEDATTKTAYLASCGVAMSDTLDELIGDIHP